MTTITAVRVHDCGVGATLVEVDGGGATGIGMTQSPGFAIAPLINAPRWGLAAIILGQEAREPESLWRRMSIEFGAQRGRGQEGGMAVNAMAALDMAAWDLAGKLLGEPLHSLLGTSRRSAVMAYASATAVFSSSYEAGLPWVFKDAATLAEECREYLRQGFKAVKFGWGNRFEPEDELRLAAIREALGQNVRLMIDFGCPAYWSPGWGIEDAIRIARMLEDYQVHFLEEPLPPQSMADFVALSAAVATPIATGESLCTEHEFQAFIDARAVAVLQPDAAQIGITALRRVALRIDQAGMRCIPHSPWSALTVASHAAVLSLLEQEAMVEYPALSSFELGSTHGRSTLLHNFQVVEQPLRLEDGYVRLSPAPGLGLGMLIPAAMARARAEAIA